MAVGVPGNLLTKSVAEGLKHLTHANEAERLRLAVAGAREAVFDWTIGDDMVVWDGAHGVLAGHVDVSRLQTGKGFCGWMSEASREKLLMLINEKNPPDPAVELEFETGSLPSEWFELRAIRLE